MSVRLEGFKQNFMNGFNHKTNKLHYLMVPKLKDVETSGKYLLRRRFYFSKLDLGITVEWTQVNNQFRFKFVEEASVYEPIYLKQLDFAKKRSLESEKHYEDYIRIGSDSIEFGCCTLSFMLDKNDCIIPVVEPINLTERVVLKKDGHFDVINAARPKDFVSLVDKRKKEFDVVYHHYAVTSLDLDKFKKLKWELSQYNEDIKYLKKLFEQTHEGLYKTFVVARILSAMEFANLTRGM